ncbi:MAG: hypothetical protein U5J62_07150 [Desulfurivibrio sp.]|nr:hypothetical protein [Desulfurivibrio sp.]
MPKTAPALLLLLLPALLLLPGACATGGQRPATSRPAAELDAETTYTLILHGCSYGNDPETIAFFDPEDHPHRLRPYSPEFQYRIIPGLTAAQAMARAGEFIICSAHYNHARLRAIIGPDGTISGYELRPLYNMDFSGQPDLLTVSYRLKEQEMMIYLTPRRLDDDSPEREQSGSLN